MTLLFRSLFWSFQTADYARFRMRDVMKMLRIAIGSFFTPVGTLACTQRPTVSMLCSPGCL